MNDIKVFKTITSMIFLKSFYIIHLNINKIDSFRLYSSFWFSEKYLKQSFSFE